MDPEVSDAKNDEGRSPDGGWGWVIAIVTSAIVGLQWGFAGCYGILMVDMLERRDFNAALAGGVAGLYTSVMAVTGPVASATIKRFSSRNIAVITAVISSLGIALCYFADTVWMLYVFYGFVFGCSSKFVTLSGFAIINQYFDKRLSFAIGIVFSGIGIAMVPFSYLLNYLVKEYGYNGAMLISSAIVLNAVPCAMNYRPLNVREEGKDDKAVRANETNKSELDTRTADRVTFDIKSPRESSASLESYFKIETHLDATAEMVDGNDDDDNANFAYSVVPSSRLDLIEMSTYAAAVTPVDSVESTERESKKNEKKEKRIKFQWSILKDIRLWIFFVMVSLFDLPFINLLVYLPFKVIEVAGSDVNEATMVSINSVMYTVSVLLASPIWDYKQFSNVYVRQFGYSCIAFITGLVILLYCVTHEYTSLYVLVVLSGAMLGLSFSPTSVIVRDMAGADLFTDYYSAYVLFETPCLFLGPLLLGAMYDINGNTYLPFLTMGFSMILSALVGLLLPPVTKLWYPRKSE